MWRIGHIYMDVLIELDAGIAVWGPATVVWPLFSEPFASPAPRVARRARRLGTRGRTDLENTCFTALHQRKYDENTMKYGILWPHTALVLGNPWPSLLLTFLRPPLELLHSLCPMPRRRSQSLTGLPHARHGAPHAGRRRPPGRRRGRRHATWASEAAKRAGNEGSHPIFSFTDSATKPL